jgi:transposase
MSRHRRLLFHILSVISRARNKRESAGIVRFLKHLLRHISGKLLVVWDGLPVHRSQAVKDFLRQGATQRVHLEQLPGYAPELNPAEGVWNYLKNV